MDEHGMKKYGKSCDHRLTEKKNGAIVNAKSLKTLRTAGAASVKVATSVNNLKTGLYFGLEEGRPREDRRTSVRVFSTSSSPFLCPRENGPEKQLLTALRTGGCNGLRQLSWPISGRPSHLPVLCHDRGPNPGNHPRRGTHRPNREKTASELPFRRSGSDEIRLARTGRNAGGLNHGSSFDSRKNRRALRGGDRHAGAGALDLRTVIGTPLTFRKEEHL